MGHKQIGNFKVVGAVAAPFTPFDENGEINFSIFEKYADYLYEHHFQNVFVNGTLGEGMSMTVEERKKCVEAWKKGSKGRLKIIAHVGANNLRESQMLARHAQETGVDAIAAFAPSYYKPPSEEAVVEYLAHLTSAAPELPFFYYCINFVTGIYLDTAKILTMAKDRVPTLRGAKISSKELPNAFKCMAIDPDRYQIMLGSDLQLITMLSLGIEVPTAASFIGDLFHEIKVAFDSGDMNKARDIQKKLQSVEDVKMKHEGGIHTMKAMFTMISGLNMGPVRLPLMDISDKVRDSLRKDLQGLKLFSM